MWSVKVRPNARSASLGRAARACERVTENLGDMVPGKITDNADPRRGRRPSAPAVELLQEPGEQGPRDARVVHLTSPPRRLAEHDRAAGRAPGVVVAADRLELWDRPRLAGGPF